MGWVRVLVALGIVAALVQGLSAPPPALSGDALRLREGFPGLTDRDLVPLARAVTMSHPHGPAPRPPEEGLGARQALHDTRPRVVGLLVAGLSSPSPYARHDAALLLADCPDLGVVKALQARLPVDDNEPVVATIRAALAQHGVDVEAHTQWLLDGGEAGKAFRVLHPRAVPVQDAWLASQRLDGAVAEELGWVLTVRNAWLDR